MEEVIAMARRNAHVVDQEVTFSDSEELVSTTDERGVITYCNEIFAHVVGFSVSELVGKNHNIVSELRPYMQS